jgi:hypothetical protein
MSDPFEVLFSPIRPVSPDAESRRRLLDDVARAIDASDDTAVTDTPRQMTLEDTSAPADAPRRRWSYLLAVAAAVAITALGAAVVVRDRNTDQPKVDQPQLTTVSPTTTPPPQTSTSLPTSTSDAFDAVIAAELARGILMDPEHDYAPGWAANSSKAIVLDRSVAAGVPGCAPFLDAVFEGPERPARADYRSFTSTADTSAIAGQYVVVFPSENEAEAMFQAMADPRFQPDCFVPYYQLTDEYGGWCCDPAEPAAPALSGTPIKFDVFTGADDLQVRLEQDTYRTDEAGVSHGPGQRTSASMRVGRVVIVMDAILEQDPGRSLISEEQFSAALKNAVIRARLYLAESDG